MNPRPLLTRFWRALASSWQAGRRAWDVAGTNDSRIRRQQLRLALLDRHRLHHHPAAEHLQRRGVVRWLP